jgi:hypothetical protein
MDLLTATGAVLPPALALLWSSSFGEARGVHERSRAMGVHVRLRSQAVAPGWKAD